MDRARDQAADGSPHTHDAPDSGRWTAGVVHRWPTALGITVAVLSASGLEDGLEFAALTVLMALVYLGAAALDRRWTAWLVLFAGLPLALFIPSIAGIDSALILLVAAPIFVVVEVARGLLPRPGD